MIIATPGGMNEVIRPEPKGPLLPFKGKGSVRRRLRELESRCGAIVEHMRQVIDELNATFRPPRPVHLGLHHNGGYHHLRWRAPVASAGQAFLDLCGSDAGRAILHALPAAAHRVILAFERRRLDLNLASSLCRHEELRLRDYLAKLDVLHECEQHNCE